MKTRDNENKQSGIFFINCRSNREKQLATFRRTNTILNILLVGRAPKFILITGVLGILFLAYYIFIATPSNFSSLSSTFWYFIPALAMLLSIAVIFNNFILNNELKAMPSDVQTEIDQVNKIVKLLELIDSEALDEVSSISSTFALYHMIKATTDAAKDEDDEHRRDLRPICIDFIDTSNYILKLFGHTKSQFTLIMMPTTDFVLRTMAAFNLNMSKEGDEKPKFLQALFQLHALKYLLARIYIRHSITGLSNDMLISVVPIMSFIAALSSFSTFSDISMIRILFSAGLAIVFLPFIMLVVRVIPMVHLMRSNASLPFPYR